MSIQDYKNATAKLREFSEYYEENRYKTWYEKAMDAKRKFVYECIERMVWGVLPSGEQGKFDGLLPNIITY